MTARPVFDLNASFIGRRTKTAIDRVIRLWALPEILMKPRYERVGGIDLLDPDRRLAHAAMRREFAQVVRLTAIRSRRHRSGR